MVVLLIFVVYLLKELLRLLFSRAKSNLLSLWIQVLCNLQVLYLYFLAPLFNGKSWHFSLHHAFYVILSLWNTYYPNLPFEVQ